MDYSDYINLALKTFLDKKGEWRIGQTLFNVLNDVRPDLSEKIRGTVLDPFYKNEPEYFVSFFTYLQENW